MSAPIQLNHKEFNFNFKYFIIFFDVKSLINEKTVFEQLPRNFYINFFSNVTNIPE